MQPPEDSEMVAVREALANCCSETKRMLPDEVLAVPAVQHMLKQFLADKSRYVRISEDLTQGTVVSKNMLLT